MKKILSIFLIAGIGGMTALSIDHFFENKNSTSSLGMYASQPAKFVNSKTNSAASPENSINFTQAAEMSVHAVVHVKTSYPVENANNLFFNNDPFRNFFYGDGGIQPQQVQPQMASGSGVIISGDGYIITNNHVVDRADKIEVTLNDKRTYNAKVIGKDPTTDLALLKIDEQNLPFLNYGNSDEVKVGEWVLAVGNPFNLTSTVTAGIVSAKGRNINILENDPARGIFPIESFIQTDAAVNPGNSGGALVSTTGQLVGINSAIASNTGSYAGYSFAIPVNIVRKVAGDLLEFGEVQRAFIGVSIRDLDAKLAKEKNINTIKGVYVNGLTQGGSAMDAGIKEGDIITKIGDVEVNDLSELQEQVSRFRPGDKIMVSVKRNNEEKTIPLVLKNKNGNTQIVEKEKIETASALGAIFEPITKEEMRKLNIDNGLRINKLDGGKLRSAGIKEGFIITGIDKKRINSTDDLKAALDNKKGGVLIEGVYPNGLHAYYGFGL